MLPVREGINIIPASLFLLPCRCGRLEAAGSVRFVRTREKIVNK